MITQINDSVIQVSHLTKYFGTQKILDDLTFDVARGKITTILGFSGAGKSTLLKHILGLLEPSSGTIHVLGQDLTMLDEFTLRDFRRNFGMLFQYAALFDSLTAIENVMFPLSEFSKFNQKEMREIAKKLLISVNLEPSSFDKIPSELSGGMRKRVGLARALALSPTIMLYDEPTTGLDPMTTKTVNDLIVDMARQHKEMTTIIISHDVKATLKISDYVAFLDRGSMVEYLTVKEFTKSQNPFVKRFLELEGFYGV